jgi:hypothetical protein
MPQSAPRNGHAELAPEPSPLHAPHQN